ncbi:MAG: aspartate aminotransferase family protein [Acidobacteria bacterium]|nr:aspartate aminotransferase family protein [Acidobacteriota bacterium]
MSIIDSESRRDSGVYPKRGLALVRGEGALVWDETGRRYIDCVTGIGAANLGHGHPRVVEAIQKQAQTLMVVPGIFSNDRRAELLERLISAAPPGIERAFLSNSGTEAVEGALKFARLHTGRPGFIAAMCGFHGRTFGALSATWSKTYRKPFEPLVPGFSHVPFNNLEALDRAVNSETAAVILEVVQGEGGIRLGSREFLRGAQELCRERGALLIVDEVQTGLGRTGRLFACEHHDLHPDLLCLAKSLGGGIPMGAVLMGERLGELPRKVHGSTLGGNPLACAAALATLDVIRDEGLVERAASLGERALQQLRGIESDRIREVRGLGLFLGVELKEKASPFVRRLQENGVLVLQAGPTVIRLLPPLVIPEGDLQQVLDALREVLTG